MTFTLKWLLPYWKKSWKRMTAIVLLGLISAALQAATPIMVKNVVNGLSQNLTWAYIKMNVFYMLALGMLSYGIGILAQRNRAYMNLKIEYEIRQNLFAHILTLDHSLYYKHTVGDLLTRLIDDISEKISWFACSGVFRFIQACLTIIAVITAMFYLNVPLSLWCLAPMPVIVFFTIKLGRKLNKRYTQLQDSISEIYDFLETSFSAIRLIKANSKENSQKEYFADKAEKQKENEINTARLQIIFSYFFHYSGFFSVFLVYTAGGLMVINGDIDLGDLVAFQFFSSMIIFPLMDVSQFFIAGNRAEASIKRVNEIFLIKPVMIKSRKEKVVEKVETLEFAKLSFKPSYSDKKILEQISFKATKNSRLAVVGKIGSGKSTVLKLLLRLMEYEEGEYLIDGLPAREINIPSLRERLAYVPQEPSIFSATIYENITLFSKDVSKEDFERALRVSQLEYDISKFPNGLKTQVGNRGFSVSGGQKQRICLARALLKNPDFLIIDDATNAMDAQTEENFWNDFSKNYSHCGSIIATHRTKTLEKSDGILVLDQGKAVENGSHLTLIASDTLYKKIYEKAKLEE
ncbi:MAG: ABC transporter ATP-binding protein [Elusimicrobiota bacterium]